MGNDLDKVLSNRKAQLLSYDSLKIDAEKRKDISALLLNNGKIKGVDYQLGKERSQFGPIEHLELIQFWLTKHKSIGESKYSDDFLKSINQTLAFYFSIDPQSNNWWHNEIGVPEIMSNIVILIGLQNLNESNRDYALKIIDRANLSKSSIKLTGQNLLWKSNIMLWYSALTNNHHFALKIRDTVSSLLVQTNLEGIQEDWSFHQHGSIFYAGGYGRAFVKDMATYIVAVNGTTYQLPSWSLENFSNLLLQCHRWLYFKGYYDHATVGRNISRKGDTKAKFGKSLRQLTLVHDVFSKPDVKQGILELIGESEPNFSGNKFFPRGNLMIHRGPNFYFSINLLSAKLRSTETGNGEGLKNYFIGHGTVSAKRKGDEYFDIYGFWNWQKLPGLINKSEEIKNWPELPWGVGSEGSQHFVGGLSDGKNGWVTMAYDNKDLRYLKSFLCIDSSVYLLISQITNQTQAEINFTLDQKNAIGQLNNISKVSKKDKYNIRYNGITYQSLDKGSELEAAELDCNDNWNSINRKYKDSATLKKRIFIINSKLNPKKAHEFAYHFGNTPKNKIIILRNDSLVQAVRFNNGNEVAVSISRSGLFNLIGGYSIRTSDPIIVWFKISGSNAIRPKVLLSSPMPSIKEIHFEIFLNRKSLGEYRVEVPKGSQIGFPISIE